MTTASKPILATTLNLLRQHHACKLSYRKLRKTLPAHWPMDRPIDLLTVLDSNGFVDTLWCFRATTTPADTIARLYACDCIEHVQHLYKPATRSSEWRLAQTILVIRRYTLGMKISKQLEIAAAAALYVAAVYAAAASASDATEEAWQTKRLRDWLTGQRTPETVRAELKDVVP